MIRFLFLILILLIQGCDQNGQGILYIEQPVGSVEPIEPIEPIEPVATIEAIPCSVKPNSINSIYDNSVSYIEDYSGRTLCFDIYEIIESDYSIIDKGRTELGFFIADESIVKASSLDEVLLVNEGESTLLINFGDLTISIDIKVFPEVVDKVIVSQYSKNTKNSMLISDYRRIYASAIYSNGDVLDITDKVDWVSSDENVVRFLNSSYGREQQGLLEGLNVGSAEVSVSLDNIKNKIATWNTSNEFTLTGFTMEVVSSINSCFTEYYDFNVFGVNTRMYCPVLAANADSTETRTSTWEMGGAIGYGPHAMRFASYDHSSAMNHCDKRGLQLSSIDELNQLYLSFEPREPIVEQENETYLKLGWPTTSPYLARDKQQVSPFGNLMKYMRGQGQISSPKDTPNYAACVEYIN